MTFPHRRPFNPRVWIVPLVLAATVGALWAFPAFWYTKRSSSESHWFGESEKISGWTYAPVPVAKAAEAVLVADRMVNGEFVSPTGSVVRVFSAKRYEEKSNEIALFMHTPDRCWTQAGWRIEPAEPSVVNVQVHGITIPVERRIFTQNGFRELVYFTGLVGGEPLPYRLDHHLSVALRYQVTDRSQRASATARASDLQFWARLRDSFVNRRELFGPKQFLRISTPLTGDATSADERLRGFLGEWLYLTDYAREKDTWKTSANSR